MNLRMIGLFGSVPFLGFTGNTLMEKFIASRTNSCYTLEEGTVEVDDFEQKRDYLKHKRESQGVNIVFCSNSYAQHNNAANQIEIGAVLKDEFGFLRFTVEHEIAHHRLHNTWPYKAFRITSIGCVGLGILSCCTSKLLKLPTAWLVLLGTSCAVDGFCYWDERNADRVACENSDQSALEAAKRRFTEHAIPYDQLPWWTRLNDMHPHPLERVALIDSYLVK